MGQSKSYRPTAIVVEEDAMQRDMIALMLDENNFDVIQCEDAETASLAVKACHPSLLITDVNLSGRMSGLELAHRAHESEPNARIIVLSGNPLEGALPDGAKFISKPFHPTMLLREAKPALTGRPGPPIVPDQNASTIQDRALAILHDFEQVRRDLLGKAVVLSDGKAGSVRKVRFDELHGLCVAISGHNGDWPVSTMKFAEEF